MRVVPIISYILIPIAVAQAVSNASGISTDTIIQGALVAVVSALLIRSFSSERRAEEKIVKIRENVAELLGQMKEIDKRLEVHNRQVAEVYTSFGVEREVAKKDRFDLRAELMIIAGASEERLSDRLTALDQRVTRNEDRLNRRRTDTQ